MRSGWLYTVFVQMVLGIGLVAYWTPASFAASGFCSSMLNLKWRKNLGDRDPSVWIDADYLKSLSEQGIYLDQKVYRYFSEGISGGTLWLDLDLYRFDRASDSYDIIGSLTFRSYLRGARLNLHNFTIRSPFLEPKFGNRLHGDQITKGWPLSAFLKSAEKLFARLKEGGIRTLEVDGAQNYVTSVLYRRFLKFRPCHETSKNIYAQLDAMYELYNRIGPKAYGQQTSLNHFSGSFGENPFDVPPAWIRAAQDYLENTLGFKITDRSVRSHVQTVHASFFEYEPVYSIEGKLIALFQWNDPEKKRLLFVNDLNGMPMIFHWNWFIKLTREQDYRLCREL